MRLDEKGELKRTLGLFGLTAIGIGDILGAGIYALVGKVVGFAGTAAWLSFVCAFVVAALTALSYAELSSRFPRSGGEAFYTHQAFRTPIVSYWIGFLVLFSGVVSMATVSHGFAGYLRAFAPTILRTGILVGFFAVLTWINFRGMKESSLTNIVCTSVEVLGLLLIIAVGLPHLGKVNYLQFPQEAANGGEFQAILQGGILAFYAFIGFEDMVKGAEEAHQPEKRIPQALLISLGLAFALYLLTTLAAVSVVPGHELSRSEAPLMLVVQKAGVGFPPSLFTGIALFAVANTALVNFVMSSRLLYGMARQGLVPTMFGGLHPTRGTPHVAIFFVLGLALFLAITGTLTLLAQTTSLLLLVVFLFVNLSLVVVKFRSPRKKPKSTAPEADAFFRVPILFPILAAGSSLYLTTHVTPRAFLTVLGLLVLASILFGLSRFRFR